MSHLGRGAVVAVAVLFVITPVGASEGAGQPARWVSVEGRGDLETSPDLVRIVFGVNAVDPSVEKAKAKVDQAINGVLAACDELSIPRSAVTATQLTIFPRYEETADKQQRVRYEVSREVEVKFAKLSQFNDLVDRAIKAGVNGISEVEMTTTKERELRQQALAKAVEDAQAQARFLADRFHVQLGDVISISTREASAGAESGVVEGVEFVTKSGATARPEFRPGPIKVSAEVFVTFALK